MKAAIKHLKKDPVLAEVIKRVPAPQSYGRGTHFQFLVESIISQQLSGKAADTITTRFKKLFPRKRFPTPADLLKTPTVKLRSVGLSGQKVKYIKELAKHIQNRNIKLHRVKSMTDQEIIEQLIKVKGIGQWTAEMFLMFSLQRPDVFSYGDLGLRNAMQKLYKLKKHPTPKQAAKISAKWSPHRTLASRYLWASLKLL